MPRNINATFEAAGIFHDYDRTIFFLLNGSCAGINSSEKDQGNK